MQRKRERLEIIYSILSIIMEHKNSIRPTPLLRFSNVSSQSFIEYYNELISKGFILEKKDKSGKKLISLSEKGFRYIEKYKQIMGFVEEFEL